MLVVYALLGIQAWAVVNLFTVAKHGFGINNIVGIGMLVPILIINLIVTLIIC